MNVLFLEGSSPGVPMGSTVPTVPPGFRPPSSTSLPSTDAIYNLSTPLLPHPPSTTPLSDILPSSQRNVGPGVESAEAFFKAALGESTKKRVKRLVTVAKSFSEAKAFLYGSHKPFCPR